MSKLKIRHNMGIPVLFDLIENLEMNIIID